jgi:hypothetical protein
MAYLGNTPQIGQYRKMDNLTFNGSTQTFNIEVGGVSFNPPTSFSMLVVLNGIPQNPGVDFSITGATISFAVAPAENTPFFSLLFGDTLYTGTPSDATVTNSKVADGAISYAKLDENAQSRLLANQIIFGV